jgi:alpha-1,6-mannosyltransferase
MPQFKAICKIPARYLVLLSFFGYVFLAIFFPLLSNYDLQPVGDIRTFAPEIGGGFLYGLLILVLFVFYWLLYHQTLEKPSLSLMSILGISCLFGVPLLFMYPINANDVYRYVIRGLISSQYGVSPFEYAPADFGDALYPLLAGEWYGATSPYGPLWEMTSFLVTSIGQENFLVDILIFKLIGLVSLVSAGLILWILYPLRRSEPHPNDNERLALTVLWALNPALLLSFVGNAHNDALMITVLLIGWLVINLGYRGPGFLLLIAASLVKPIALLAAPIIFISSWRELDSIRERYFYLLWVLIGSAALLFFAFLPFGDPVPLIVRLLREASEGASFSPLTLVILIAWELGMAVSFGVLARLATLLFLLVYLVLLWRTWRGNSAEQGLAVAFFAYVLQAFNFRIWYASWPFPWLLVDAYRGDKSSVQRLHIGLWFLVTSQLSVIIYGHLRVSLLGGSLLSAHLIGVLFVFLLPFVLARFSAPTKLSNPLVKNFS